ncbi:MAG TPA: hypothetical protein PKM61_06560, partial [bacterium]|nr:hypothetical protein [bacterium]
MRYRMIAAGLLAALTLTAAAAGRAQTRPAAEEYHWGRDAAYFDRLDGFGRALLGSGRSYAGTRQTGSSIQARLDRELPPGSYRVLVQSWNVDTGLNQFEVDLNGAVARLKMDGARFNREAMTAVLTTTRPGDLLTITAREIGQRELRLYWVWLSSNLGDQGEFRRGVALGPLPGSGGEPAGNLLPGSSFEAGLNDLWGKAYASRGFIIDDYLEAAVDAPHGRFCLRLPDIGPVRLVNRPVPVTRGGRFTLSGYFRTLKPAAVQLTATALRDLESRPAVFTAPLETGPEWKRTSTSFELPTDFTGTIQVSVLWNDKQPDPAAAPTDIWTDAIQLERGELTAYRSAYESEAGLVITGKPGAVFYTGEPVGVEVAAAGTPAEIELKILDLNLQPVLEKRLNIAVEKGRGGQLVRLELSQPGAYLAVVRSLAPGAAPAVRKAFALIEPPPDRPRADLRTGLYATLSPESVPIFHRLGFRYLNTLSAMAGIGRMSLAAPERDRYLWYDWAIDLANQNGVEVVVCLGNRYPAWALEPGKTYPSIAAWTEFVARMVEHYRGRVHYWMVEDEPGGRVPADHYQKMVAAARQAVQKIDPAASVVMHGDSVKFFGQVMAAAGGKHDFYDILAGGANLAANTKPQIEAARAAGKEVWAITFGGSKDSLYTEQPTGATAGVLAKFFVERLHELDVSRFFHYDARIMGMEPGTYWSRSSLFEFDGAFRPAGIAYAAAGNLLAGSRPLAGATPFQGLQVYQFERDGGRLAALWTDGRILKGRLTKTDGLTRRDTTGAVQPLSANGEIILDSNPRYLAGGPDLAERLAGLRLEPALDFVTYVEETPGSRAADFVIRLKNNLSTPLELTALPQLGTASWFAVAGNRRRFDLPVNLTLKPGETGRIAFPCLSHPEIPLPPGAAMNLELVSRLFSTRLPIDLAGYRANRVAEGGFKNFPSIHGAGYPMLTLGEGRKLAVSRDGENL